MNRQSLRTFVVRAAVVIAIALLLLAVRKLRSHVTAATASKAKAAGPASDDVTSQATPTKPDSVAISGPTVINVSPTILHDHVSRLGLNLGSEDYYDSLQLLKNLVSSNPGFEGSQWQSVLKCGQAGVNSCTGGPNSGSWPEGFLDGGTYEVITGPAKGTAGTILHSTAGTDHAGTVISFAPADKSPGSEDYIVVRKITQGDPTAGWGVQAYSGATVAAEYKDLSPRTPGSQAVRIKAHGPGQYVYLKQYFDGAKGHVYVRMHGPYTVRFRAKGVSAGASMTVSVDRSSGSPFRQMVVLDTAWKDYTFSFNANEQSTASGTAALVFTVESAEVLLDDVSLAEATPNGTAFRSDVVATLERLKPGVLRYMDSGQNWGSNLDNMIAPEHARKRSGYNRYLKDTNDIPIGLNDFLVLCEKIGAEPWYTMQMGMEEKEAGELMEFLGGPPTTKYGAARVALGHPVPWTKTFPEIHLEMGNEAWNDAQPGQALPDAVPYSERVTTIFRDIRSSPWYAPGRVDLIADGQFGNVYQTAKVLETAQALDTIDIAPYSFNIFSDDSSIENIFGPMFAQPEMWDSRPDSFVRLHADQARKANPPARLAVYEMGIDTGSGTVSQASIDAAVPSVGAGIAAIDHMLLMLRDAGVTVQCLYQLGGGTYHFNNTAGRDPNETSPIWGLVIDMGGATDRVRPSFLAEQLVNQGIRPTMLTTSVMGYDPKWDQPLSANDKIELKGAHELQTFAFSDKETSSLLAINLSRTERRAVAVSGACAPQGLVTVKTLTSANITDSNEAEDKVKLAMREEQNVVAGKSQFELPPFSITLLTSANGGCTPVAQPVAAEAPRANAGPATSAAPVIPAKVIKKP